MIFFVWNDIVADLEMELWTDHVDTTNGAGYCQHQQRRKMNSNRMFFCPTS